MTHQQLTVTAQVICDVFTPDMIRNLDSKDGGSEILRLIVRDDLAGAADKITSALWVNL